MYFIIANHETGLHSSFQMQMDVRVYLYLLFKIFGKIIIKDCPNCITKTWYCEWKNCKAVNAWHNFLLLNWQLHMQYLFSSGTIFPWVVVCSAGRISIATQDKAAQFVRRFVYLIFILLLLLLISIGIRPRGPSYKQTMQYESTYLNVCIWSLCFIKPLIDWSFSRCKPSLTLVDLSIFINIYVCFCWCNSNPTVKSPRPKYFKVFKHKKCRS